MTCDFKARFVNRFLSSRWIPFFMSTCPSSNLTFRGEAVQRGLLGQGRTLSHVPTGQKPGTERRLERSAGPIIVKMFKEKSVVS